jgi:nucleoside-diphosphate-sugar epimerase
MGERRRILVTGGSGFIGTHLMGAIRAAGEPCLNLDRAVPPVGSQREHWRRVDLRDAAALAREVAGFRPSHVVHLAARTDTTSDRLGDYLDNTEGTRALIDALEARGVRDAVERVVITSSQFVVGPGDPPAGDEDFRPHTTYGESKVLTERMTRRSGLPWTIVRPTNIWGPWHPRYPREFWAVLRRGLYLHPGRRPVMRCYGYVGNVAHQILRTFELPAAQVLHKVLYLGDAPLELHAWTDGFSRAITGRPVRVVPRSLLRAVALCGDVAVRLGLRAPLHSSRFRSMTEDYLVPMQPTFDLLGPPPITLEHGIDETVAWLRSQGFFGVTPGGASRRTRASREVQAASEG